MKNYLVIIIALLIVSCSPNPKSNPKSNPKLDLAEKRITQHIFDAAWGQMPDLEVISVTELDAVSFQATHTFSNPLFNNVELKVTRVYRFSNSSLHEIVSEKEVGPILKKVEGEWIEFNIGEVSLRTFFGKGEYNNNSQSEGFEAAFSENERPYDEPENVIEIDNSLTAGKGEGTVALFKTSSDLRRLVRNYYQYLEGDNWSDLEKMFPTILNRFYGEYNYSKFKVLTDAKDYKSKFNILSTEYNVRWKTFKVNKKGDNYIVSFIMDYELIKRNSKKRSFVLNIFMEFDENRKIRSIYENKL